MLNAIFFFVVLVSVLLAAASGRMEALNLAIFEQAKAAVTLAINLVGVMAFFLGLMRVAEDAGLLRVIDRMVGPVMRRLFPSVPPGHPAMSAMILNIAANMMGLTNAATPFGIKAIEQLDTLNSRHGTATNDMVLFLAINTSGLAILPSGVAALRASLGSTDPWGIWITTMFASGCATIVGITAAWLYARLPGYRSSAPPPLTGPTASAPAAEPATAEDAVAPARSRASTALGVAFWVVFVMLLARFVWLETERMDGLDLFRSVTANWTVPALIAAILIFAWSRRVRVYESLVEGAKDGFQVALRIIPYLVAILVMVGMLRAAGGIELLVRFVGPLTDGFGMPAEALPMALLRPLSGSGAFGIMAAIMEEHGPDSFIGYLVSTFQGSTETTLYVLAVYFGAVGVKRSRHALAACLTADVAGILAAVFIVNLLFG
ncbi:MAG TPA: nucleoside recognition domain-containing protein [Candidatus Polarisedimenticolaceae bacterium]|nr:nucleoside recognition domain-containing protein [Candidatus Polarisedimenticolaceae bacterium]